MQMDAHDRPALADLSWPRVPAGATVLVPVGATEQHGPHLPLDVDTVIADAVSRAAAQRCGPGVRVAPAVAFGASGEHQDFPGTLSLGTEALTHALVELGRSARTWAARIVFVNGHGGNLDAVTAAVDRLVYEGMDAAWHPCRHGDVHAGRPETSLMLHLNPGRVDLAAARPGATAPLAELLPLLRERGVRAVSPTGVLGDPRGAAADEGAALLEQMAGELVTFLTGGDT